MDRDHRRFHPSGEGLEGRALLSFFGSKPLTRNQITLQDLPTTDKLKTLRIAHLPFFLTQENQQRFLPSNTMTALQADITDIIASLHAPTVQSTNDFNRNLRHLLVQNNLSSTNINLLNNSFSNVLVHAGATPQQVQSFRADMTALAQVDVVSVQPSQLARNDYSLVLQTTLAVGRPIETPMAPSISTKDGTRVKGGGKGYTGDHFPLLVGNYQAGGTKIGYVRMQVIDSKTGYVIGESPVDSNGNWLVKSMTYLPDGVYDLRTRVIDEVGHMSYTSPHAFKLRVFTPHHKRAAAEASLATITTTTANPQTPIVLPAIAANTNSSSTSTTASKAALTPPGGPLALLNSGG
jgi:hypothetical protein